MTIQFRPGDPNRGARALDQAWWKNHKIIAYGSGNNLIVYSITDSTRSSLQTIYLERDVETVAINGTSGLICIGSRTKIITYKPVNEYMSVPKWTQADETVLPSGINCIAWAPIENEIAVGTDCGAYIFHIFLENGEVNCVERWNLGLLSPVTCLDITEDAARIVTYNSRNYNSFAQVWTRSSYGNSSTRFELEYADHEPDEWLTHFKWRTKPASNSSPALLESMAHIKNVRSYFSSGLENDVLYTVTNKGVLNIWATYEFNGHSHLRRWRTVDLRQDITSPLRTAFFVEKSDLDPICDGACDVVVVLGQKDAAVYKLLQVEANPPNSIKVELLAKSLPPANIVPHFVDADTLDASSEEAIIRQNPLVVRGVVVDTESISFLMHDRIKNTIRVAGLDVKKLFSENTLLLVLRTKLQGHTKSVQKLVSSSSSPKNNVILSISNFADHNYVWEPLQLPGPEHIMSITKRFRVNVLRAEDNGPQGIIQACMINDIEGKSSAMRRHLVVAVEIGGFLSCWDCNSQTMDDRDAKLIDRIPIDVDGELMLRAPQALLVQESTAGYLVVCVYDEKLIIVWEIRRPDYKLHRCDADPLPGSYVAPCMISAVDTYLEKDLSVIDAAGAFKQLSPVYQDLKVSWVIVGEIQTGIQRARYIHGASLINKLAITDETGLKLSIWDTKSGVLEHEEIYPAEQGEIRDLDWTFIGDALSTNAILAVGFLRFVLMYSQLRYDYTNSIPTFAVVKKIDVSDYTSHTISDSIWLDDGLLVIGCGNQFFIDDKWVSLAATTSFLDSTIRELLVGCRLQLDEIVMSELTKILNGPLPLYHPQFLIQALLMSEINFVEDILVHLLKTLRTDESIQWDLKYDLSLLMKAPLDDKKRRASWAGIRTGELDILASYNSTTVDLLAEKLTKISIPLLTRHQQNTLLTVVNIVHELKEYVHSLDENGLKFVLELRLFLSSLKQPALSMRDISWALHSDQKEMLFGIVEKHYKGEFTWARAKRAGLVYWLHRNKLTTLIESIARYEFGQSRDPSGIVSLLFLAIKKKQVLVGLWKTIYHPEREKLLKFLSNNFAEPKWKTAASKNAFALLSKHRYMDAAYFFLLADQVKDCCITLCNKVGDVDLALAVTRVNHCDEALMYIIEEVILPRAFNTGDRWTTSWVFWELKKKEKSIQALVLTPHDVVRNNAEIFSDRFRAQMDKTTPNSQSLSFLCDDPVLAVLYEELRSTKLNYYEGSLAISPQAEFDFVTKVCSTYTRMGCDYLALKTLTKWKFLDERKASHQEHEQTPDIFKEFAAPAPVELTPAFEEPDMSLFSFGF